MNIDVTVEKLGRNRGYKHLGTDGTVYHALKVAEIVDALDNVLCFRAINDSREFVKLVYQIVAHQTYHADIEEISGIPYQSIAAMLKEGEGNPLINKLEDILNGIGVSLAICTIEARENDVPHETISRACFFQHLIKRERWNFTDTIALLFKFGLQFRLFELDQSKQFNDLSHISYFTILELSDESLREMYKDIHSLSTLLQFFNTNPQLSFIVQPPGTANE